MNSNSENGSQKLEVQGATLIALIKAFVVGFAIYQLGRAIYEFFSNLAGRTAESPNVLYAAGAIAILYLSLIPIAVLVFQSRAIGKAIKSKRIDLTIAFGTGCLAGMWFATPFLTLYLPLLSNLSTEQELIIAAIPTIFAALILAQIIHQRSSRGETKDSVPIFISDSEKLSPEEDFLDVLPDAERFSRYVLNDGSKSSMVFGLDAPWGSGKSSFINFCADIWSKKHKDKVIVYQFNPLQYEDRKHLLSKFVDGMIQAVRAELFLPELRPTASRYAAIFKGDRKFSFAGFDFNLGYPSVSVERATKQLEEVLSKLPRRLIVIVDDLDRMEFPAIKDILYVIKKGFSFQNVSYILCYDTQNIAALDAGAPKTEKIAEFLEKFVNVKQGLFPTSDKLKDFVTRGGKLAGDRNITRNREQIDHVLKGLIAILDSADYPLYLPLVGDLRKIKRLLNILVLLNFETFDLRNADFDVGDLIHLLLIYVNFPIRFRHIYNCETGKRSGFYSLSTSGNKYSNSVGFTELLKSLRKDRSGERLLLERLFSVERLKKSNPNDLPQLDRHTLACLNDHTSERANLASYLELIVKVAKPIPAQSYRELVALKDMVRDGKPLESIFASVEPTRDEGEDNSEQFWRVILNNLEEFDSTTCSRIIRYLITALPQHSMLEIKKLDLGFRNSTLVYFLLKILDVGGWTDGDGLHRDNTEGNLRGITDWIYGEGEHRGEGILEALSLPGRGFLGWHDLMVFRLYCCIDRNSSLFSLCRAVGTHSDLRTPQAGVLTDIVRPQMREMSQWVFARFREQYIDPQRSIFAESENLSAQAMTGDFVPTIMKALEKSAITGPEIEDARRDVIVIQRSFILYQLTNKLISSGIGCGYYDVKGDGDSGEIYRLMNEYIFNVCFSQERDPRGQEFFVEYLLSQLARNFGVKIQFVANVNNLLPVLDPDMLRNYWQENRTEIIAKFGDSQKIVRHPSHTCVVGQVLRDWIRELDNYVSGHNSRN